MEFLIKLNRVSGRTLPINYQYPLSSWVYQVIAKADQAHADFLHDTGHALGHKKFKLFTFSNLSFLPFKVHDDRIRMEGNEATLSIRFLVDRSLEAFIKGLFMSEKFGLGDKKSRVDFEVTQVERVASPIFKPVMRCRCLTPVCLSMFREGKPPLYLHPEHDGYGVLLKNNLLAKQKAMIPGQGEEEMMNMKVAPGFRLLNTPKSRLVTVKAGTPAETKVKGFVYNFEITLPTELHELAYYAGWGEKNALGFGCVDFTN